jgi:glucosylceramidase
MRTTSGTRSPHTIAVAAMAALAVTLGTAALVQASPAYAATSAQVWVTTPDRGRLLARQADVALDGGGSGSTITVNPNDTFQTMVGFGASLTDSAASNIAGSPQRDQIMSALFSPSDGIGLNWLRQPIGASDFARSFYTYDDGAADPGLYRFSIAHDRDQILPLIQQAQDLNPELTVMATPWSAPAWMKTNNALIGGSLQPSYNSTFADYLVRFVQAYEDEGVPISYLSVQNEPQYSPPGYPGMLMSSSQQADVINQLAPKLASAGLSTKILTYDHNWDNTSYAREVLNSSVGKYVAGSAWHCYGGDPSAQSTVHDAFPTKDIFFTECSGIVTADTFADSLKWQGTNLAINSVRNWSRTVTTWNLALDANHGPVIGSCTNCMGVVTTDGGGYTTNAEYYVLGHLSKFVEPGAVRIGSTGYGDGGVQNVAFRNPDGTIVLVALNTGGTQDFKVSYQGTSFGYNLPAGAMATFTWPGTGTPTPTTSPTTPPDSGSCTVDSSSWYRITSTSSGKSLDVRDNSTVNGAVIQQWDYVGGANQKWQLVSTGDGYYKIVSQRSGRALDVAGVSTADGAGIQQWDYVGGNNQQWRLSGVAGGCTITARHSGKALDVRGNSTANGAVIQQWDYVGGVNQKWTLVAVG